ncbi:tRNA pseudouridine(55) synthase TruB [Actinomycetaceae bacterium MB13-C1-2]|nr:tRNA pseudouridine(55) synthase TruB [Actinomycetaceae bacterium MB13-C1-2]
MAPQKSSSEPVGLLVVDKPQGISSHGVVSRARRLLKTRKVGHGGTLDPMATGVLVLGVGRGTKLLGYVSGDSKTYRATIRLGIGTVTEDAEGEVEEAPGFVLQDVVDIDRAIARFVGLIEQVPSAVSAIKVDGKRAYALVRAGEDVQLRPRAVEVFTFERTSEPRTTTVDGVRVVDIDVDVDCSSGTYVRALARDLARELGTAGHLTALRRTRVGSFNVERAQSLEELQQTIDEGRQITLIPLEQAVKNQFPLVVVSDAAATAFANGRPITPDEVVRLDSSNTMSGDKLPVEVEENRGVTHERTFPLPDENLFPPGPGDPVKEDPSRGSGGEDRVVAIAEESNPTIPLALVRFENGKFRSVLHLRVAK